MSTYPISGRFGPAHDGAAPDCRAPPSMEFNGDRRFDTGFSSVLEYRALSIVPYAQGQFKIRELFFNGQIEGQVSYILHVRDRDHAILRFQMGGHVLALARCS